MRFGNDLANYYTPKVAEGAAMTVLLVISGSGLVFCRGMNWRQGTENRVRRFDQV
jgi:hypothetical protein